MNRREAERLTRQRDTLVSLGFTHEEAESLRRISMTLHRWHELECGTDTGCIERGRKGRNPQGEKEFIHDENGVPYWASHVSPKPFYYRIPDRETGARKRLAAIVAACNARRTDPQPEVDEEYSYSRPLSAYIQGDPRGAALYILRPGDVPEGESADAYYSRGIAVY